MEKAGAFSKAGQWGEVGKDFSHEDELVKFWVGRVRRQIGFNFVSITCKLRNLEQIIAVSSSFLCKNPK